MAHGAEHRGENAELGRGTEKQGFGVGQQGAEIGHGPHAHEISPGVPHRWQSTRTVEVVEHAIAETIAS